MPPPRLFLVAPDMMPGELLACLKAACAVGDVASLFVPPQLAESVTKSAQTMGVAIMTGGDPRNVSRNGCDGLHIEANLEAYEESRSSLGPDRIVGAYCGTSRHQAMEMAEAGADYVAISQSGFVPGGVPIISWWSEMFEVPCVAFDPVDAASLDTLLPQNPDFIRPSDAMWSSPEEARRIVASITARINP